MRISSKLLLMSLQGQLSFLHVSLKISSTTQAVAIHAFNPSIWKVDLSEFQASLQNEFPDSQGNNHNHHNKTSKTQDMVAHTSNRKHIVEAGGSRIQTQLQLLNKF